MSLHFEVVPDNLPDALKVLLLQFPPGVLQLEIGIQSFNPEVQQVISRKQDNLRTEDNLRWLREHTQAHLHTDLIFGLPGESWDSFAQGFDRLYALRPQEIQLGLLKRLRGTPLAGSKLPDMMYEATPPYSVVQTEAVSNREVQDFVQLARYWDRIANSGRFSAALALLMQGASPFEQFADFAQWMAQQQAPSFGLTPEALVDWMARYLTAERAFPLDTVTQALRQDYVASGARGHPASLHGSLPRQRGLQRRLQALQPRQNLHGSGP